jgi:colicin import membrane protein
VSAVRSTLFYWPAGLLALALHGLVAAALLATWSSAESTLPQPEERYYIEASMVAENPHRARKEAKARALSARQRARRLKLEADAKKTELARIRAKRLLAEKRRVEERKRLAALQPEPEEQDDRSATAVRAEAERQASEAERKRMEQTLALAIIDEQDARRAVTDDEKALAYIGQIKGDIVRNWSRPPSARNGMEALLRVYMVPTGEVVNVEVQESSGNDAFDRSALLAVRKASPFRVPTESRQFERIFREFTVNFRPEDLRL